MQVVGPYKVRDDDLVLPYTKDALELLDPEIVAKDVDARVFVQSTNPPAGTPVWAWGFTPKSTKVWVNLTNPYVDVVYSINHEYGHTWDMAYLLQSTRREFMKLMVNVVTGEPVKGWNSGDYTSQACYVPAEAFADAFAKAQGNGEFRRVLPRFFKVRVPRANYPAFLNLLGSIETVPVL